MPDPWYRLHCWLATNKYIEDTLIPQIKEDWMHDFSVEQVECYEISNLYITVLTTTTCTACQTSTNLHNPDCNRVRNGRQPQKTSFDSSNNNLSNGLAKENLSNNPNWDTLTRKLDQKTMMELMRNKKYPWCHNQGHNCKVCMKQQGNQPMVTTTQALSVRRESRLKGLNKDWIKERCKCKATKNASSDCRKVLGKTDMHHVLPLVDIQTQGGDLIDSTFVQL